MTWEVPSFVEIKMDSEIGSYQDDFLKLPDAKEQFEGDIVSAERS